MRELTHAEIERFDFTGYVPDMNMPADRHQLAASAKPSKRQIDRKVRPAIGRRLAVA